MVDGASRCHLGTLLSFGEAGRVYPRKARAYWSGGMRSEGGYRGFQASEAVLATKTRRIRRIVILAGAK